MGHADAGGSVLRAARIAVGVDGAGAGKRRNLQEARHQHRLLTVTYYVSLCSKETMDGKRARSAQYITQTLAAAFCW